MPGSFDDECDETLMQAYARGDAAAFDVLYARHKGGVFRYLLRHCGNGGTAEELFQDVWMSAIRARATYVPTAKFATWLYTLARHRLVDHWRSTGQASLVSADDEATRNAVAALPASDADGPEARAGNRELAGRIQAALA